MADRIVYRIDYKVGGIQPLKYVDNGDGTYSRSVRTSVGGANTKRVLVQDINTGRNFNIVLVEEDIGH